MSGTPGALLFVVLYLLVGVALLSSLWWSGVAVMAVRP